MAVSKSLVPFTAMDFGFKVRLKPKRNRAFGGNLSPFPRGIFEGIFTGLSVEIFKEDAILEISKNGCYGKGSASRGMPETQAETLVLQMEEAFFLAYFLEVLNIKNLDGKLFEYSELLQASLKLNPRFIETFAAYVYLKSKNWVVKSGSKFGGDYIIYKDGPEFFHASFVVYVMTPNVTQFWEQKNLKAVNRVAETSNKDVLLLEITIPEEFVLTNIEDLNQITVAEIIILRVKMSTALS